jgi:hypothetical protein
VVGGRDRLLLPSRITRSSVRNVFRFLKRMILLAGVGAIARKVMDSRSKPSGSGTAQWPPISPNKPR